MAKQEIGMMGMVGLFTLGALSGVGGSSFLMESVTETTPMDSPDLTDTLADASIGLGVFDINVRGSNGGRVLRMEISVEVLPGKAELVEAQKNRLRDGVITLAGDYSYPELEGLDGKNNLRDELIGRLNALMPQPAIQELHFTQFVVQ